MHSYPNSHQNSHQVLSQLDCPVCDRQSITDSTCPNCGTDLTVLRMLHNLEAVDRPTTVSVNSEARRKTFLIWAVLLLSSIAFSSIGYALAVVQRDSSIAALPAQSMHTQLLSLTQSPLVLNPSSAGPNKPFSPTPQPCFNYTVRAGDSLTHLAWMFYGDADYWPAIAAANPRLEQVQYQLEIAEQLCIPNL